MVPVRSVELYAFRGRRPVALAKEGTALSQKAWSKVSGVGISGDSKSKDASPIRPDGFNVGLNVGSAAGQTVEHCHIHLIPRRSGDSVNPRGGVRGVIAGKADYSGGG